MSKVAETSGFSCGLAGCSCCVAVRSSRALYRSGPSARLRRPSQPHGAIHSSRSKCSASVMVVGKAERRRAIEVLLRTRIDKMEGTSRFSLSATLLSPSRRAWSHEA
eukprot:scaffold303_cov410-Prasinococcus_capsulatus_cf.AAC.11